MKTPELPYIPTMPDMAHFCNHYPKEKKNRDPPEDHCTVENHHIDCVIFGHNWKFTEDRWKINSDEPTENLNKFRFIGITRQCKRCGTFGWEYFPFDRFDRHGFVDSLFDNVQEVI